MFIGNIYKSLLQIIHYFKMLTVKEKSYGMETVAFDPVHLKEKCQLE